MATAPKVAPADTLPNFLPEDYLALLRAAVGLAWFGLAAMAVIRLIVHAMDLPWPQLGGFSQTYWMMVAEFTVVASALSVLAIRREWFERVPREASQKLRALLTLVIVWLSVHLFAAFHTLGGLHGPLLPLLPLLLAVVFLCLPRSAAAAVAALILGGHVAVMLMESIRWIQSPGALAGVFAPDGPAGTLVLLAVFCAAMALGWLARMRFDQAGANLHRGSRANPLTGLYEQEFLMQRLATEMQRQRRHGGTLALLMIEFDGFSAYTAARGYEAGRQALHHAARVLIQHTRHEMDTPARYAPTTFALLLPDARKDQAGEIAARIFAAMAEVSRGELHPRAGMACVVDAGGLGPGAVVTAAGEALRHARPDGVPAQVDVPLKPPQPAGR